MTAQDLSVSGLATFILFGATAIATAVYYSTRKRTSTSEAVVPTGVTVYKPLNFSPSDLAQLGRQCTELGGILAYAFACENYPLFPHEAKTHDMVSKVLL